MGLLERDAQLATLVDALHSIDAGGRLVLISGEAGAGKTALVLELCRQHVEPAGTRLLAGRCDDLFAARPLGPFVDIARAQPSSRLATALAADQSDQGAVFEALLADLSAPPHPVVLVLEDLQWADEASLDLLRVVARRLDVLPCLVVATFRADVASDHPLRRAWGSLVGPNVTRLALEPLSVEAVAALAAGTRLDPATLHARTAGNPFFVTEVVAAEHASALPATVRDTILTRAANLGGGARDCLDAAAVLGRHATADLIELVADGDLAGIDECIAAGLLVDDVTSIRFRHDLSREAIEEGMTPLRRRQLHRRALSSLVDVADVDPVRLAHHAVGGGEAASIVELAVRAADECIALGAHRQAASLYAQAVEAAAGTTLLEAAERLRVVRALAESSMRIDRVGDAVRAGEEVLAALVEAGDDVALGEWEVWLSNALWTEGQPERSWRHLESGVARLDAAGPSPALASGLAQLSGHHLVTGSFEECIVCGRRALELADALELEDVAVHALDKMGTAMVCLGDESGFDLLYDGLDRGKRAGVVYQLTGLGSNLAGVLAERGRSDEALAILADALVMTEAHEMGYRRNCLLVQRSEVLVLDAAWEPAVADAHALLAQADVSDGHRCLALLTLGRVASRRGDPDAPAVLDECLRLAIQSSEAQRIVPTLLAQAAVASYQGDSVTAVAKVEAAAAHEDHLTLGDLSELAMWARRTGASWTPPPELDLSPRDRADQWAAVGWRFLAADALADSDDEADLRDAHERLLAMGCAPRAAQVARRLRELGARDISRGPRASTKANVAGLTARESEVARLLGDGLTNGEIAERLVLSPKTVDHHVSAVLSKLGVSSRRQVAGALSTTR